MSEKNSLDTLYENALKATQLSEPPKVSYEFVRNSVIQMYKQIHAGLFVPLDQHSGGNPGALERQKKTIEIMRNRTSHPMTKEEESEALRLIASELRRQGWDVDKNS